MLVFKNRDMIMSSDNEILWKEYNLNDIVFYDVLWLIERIKSSEMEVVLFGASAEARYALAVLKYYDVDVDYICDSSFERHGTIFCGYKLASPDILLNDVRNVCVFICASYPGPILSTLRLLEVECVYSCVSLFSSTDMKSLSYNFDGIRVGKSDRDIERDVDLYRHEFSKFTNRVSGDGLRLHAIDVVITESCSMKCKDCSNLMQYYSSPKKAELTVLYHTLDKILSVIDYVYELRVLGGEPFMVKNINEVIDKLVLYENVGEVVVYTNGTIVPKGDNLKSLKDKKVLVDISDYGDLSRNYHKLKDSLEENGIRYAAKIPRWTDSGKFVHDGDKTENQLKEMFSNCCVNDVLTLLHGKLYHCPFSAHAANLKAIPDEPSDVIDIDALNKDDLRIELNDFYRKKQYLTACGYCNGRDFNTPDIEVAIQTKNPLPIPILFE